MRTEDHVADLQLKYGLTKTAAEELVLGALDSARKKAQIREKLAVRRATNYLSFLHSASPEMDWDSQLAFYLSSVVDRVISGELKNVTISLGPRSGKSELVTKRLPVYWLETRPSDKVIVGGYNHTVSRMFTSAGLRIYRDRNPSDLDMEAEDEWGNHAGGSVRAVGVGSGVTGFGGDCFPGDTSIKTTLGDIDIETLSLLQYKPEVLAFDHASGEIVTRKVLASREIESDDIFEIVTSNGRKIRATGNHRFYTVEDGYKAANCLSPGDRFVVAEDSLPVMRKEKGLRKQALPEMLFCGARANSGTDMCFLQQQVREKRLRVREGAKERNEGFLLFGNLLSVSSRNQEFQELPDLRHANVEYAQQAVLFRHLQGHGEEEQKENSRYDRMPGVPEEIPQEDSKADTLFARMCRFGSSKKDGWIWKLKLQKRKKLHKIICRNETTDSGERRKSVRSMWMQKHEENQGKHCRSSYRRESEKQYTGEHDNTLQALPYNSPQVSYESVSVVRKVRTGRIPVYDIQVEGCHNFFANNILVHNCILLDDVVKSHAEAFSKSYRDRCWNWYINDLRTRRNNLSKTPTIIIGTRWHRDDIIGRVHQEAEPGEWTDICIPAIAGENDVLGRLPGESINPIRLPISALLREKKLLGPRFDSLYQGKPIDESGVLFDIDKFEYVDEVPIEAHRVRAWDKAATEGGGDWTVGVLMAYDKQGIIYVEDVIRGQWSRDKVREKMKETLIADGEKYNKVRGYRVRTWFEREPAGDGKTAADDIIRMMAPYEIYADRPSDNKTARAAGWAVCQKAGNAKIKRAAWNPEYIDEHARFVPDIDNRQDDQVDGSALSYNKLVIENAIVSVR